MTRALRHAAAPARYSVGVRRLILVIALCFTAAVEAELRENVAARADATQTYTLYLPSGYDPAKKPPVLLIFDPRGRGTSAAEIFRDAAEEYGWVLVSSNQTRSDGDTTPNDRAVHALLPEARRYSTGRLYATGFSGTAMLAWAVGVKTGALTGVIGVGGRLVGEVPPAHFNFAHYGFAGERDFNNREMRQIEELLAREEKVPHRFQSFDGDHRWITPALAREAFGWFEVLADNESVRAKVLAEDLAAADASRGLEALRRYRAIARTYGLASVQARLRALESDRQVQRELAEERTWDAFEQQFRRDVAGRVPSLRGASVAEVRRAFRVTELQRRATRSGAEAAAARRLLEVVFVQCAYSLPPQLLPRRDRALAASLLAVALEIHPDRKDVRAELRRVREGE